MIQGDVFAIAKALIAGSRVADENPEQIALLKTKINTKLTGARTGRIYTTLFFTDRFGQVHPYGSRPPHQASAPGEAPARDSGHLLSMMRVKSENVIGGVIIRYEAHALYAKYLEFGTRNMAPRPFMRPIAKEHVPVMVAVWAAGIVRRERASARASGGTG
jgi:hypothetical protein